jgi:hypothetical protein
MHVKSERLKMKVYRSFCLSDEQMADLAEHWHAWRRHRVALDRNRVNAAARLDALLPSPEDLQLGLLSASMHLPEHDEHESAYTLVETSSKSVEQGTAKCVQKHAQASTDEAENAACMRFFREQGNQSSGNSCCSSQGNIQEDEGAEARPFGHYMYSTEDQYAPEALRNEAKPAQDERSGCNDHDPLQGRCGTNSDACIRGMHDDVGAASASTQLALPQDGHAKNALLLKMVEEASGAALGGELGEAACMHTQSSHLSSNTARGGHHDDVTEQRQGQHAAQCRERRGLVAAPPQLTCSAASQQTMQLPEADPIIALLEEIERPVHMAEGEGTSRSKRLLGESGYDMHEVQETLMELIDCSQSDMLLIKQCTHFMFGLNPVCPAALWNMV